MGAIILKRLKWAAHMMCFHHIIQINICRALCAVGLDAHHLVHILLSIARLFKSHRWAIFFINYFLSRRKYRICNNFIFDFDRFFIFLYLFNNTVHWMWCKRWSFGGLLERLPRVKWCYKSLYATVHHVNIFKCFGHGWVHNYEMLQCYTLSKHFRISNPPIRHLYYYLNLDQ